MAAEVKFVVYGHSDEDGMDWHLAQWYDTFEEASVRAEREIKYCSEVWIEKHTSYREIVKSISGPGLPETALIPA